MVTEGAVRRLNTDMMKRLTAGCVGVVVLAFAGVTQAATIDMRFDGITGQSTGYFYTGAGLWEQHDRGEVRVDRHVSGNLR